VAILKAVFAYFMQLSKAVKMTIVICFFLLAFTFMYFTYQAGYWGLFLEWVFSSTDKAPPKL